ncbi:MAG: APC family permease [Polyangiales bacterium]
MGSSHPVGRQRSTAFLGLGSGIGLVIANMVGAGVFLSAGFMAQQLSAGWILLAWCVGALLAMAGARAYAEVAFLIPRSGGEYRYLSELFHPALGYLAGWASLLVGFSAPIAISAYGAAAFFFTVSGGGDARIGATALVLALGLFHAMGLRTSKWMQNTLVILKGSLILAFVGLGLSLGDNRWPIWQPASGDEGVVLPFATSLLFVAYAFSGWNAAAYAAEEFETPRRDVPRAMLIGCAVVGAAYLLVNWILVANLAPERAKVVFEYEESRVTLAHVVAGDFLGDAGSAAVSLGIAVMLISSTSAMALLGPRVCAEMAGDGFLPRWLQGTPGEPPRAAIALQALFAIALLYTHTIGELLSNVAGILILFSGLVAVGLFRLKHRRPDLPAPRRTALVAAAIYAASCLWLLFSAFENQTGLLPWVAVAAAVAMVAYGLAQSRLR